MISMKKEGEWLIGCLREEEEGLEAGHLLREVWRLPRKTVHLLFQHKGILLDGTPAAQHHKLKAGQTIAMQVCTKEELGLDPVAKPLDILYEDDHLLVANKPAGLLVHPTEKHHFDTLDHRVAHHFQQKCIEAKVRHVHRLDQETSGAILYAKHAVAAAMLDEALREKRIKRTYIAFVHGKPARATETIRAAIGRDRNHATRRRVVPQGEQAVTHYQVVETYKQTAQLECRLETGKTHQIRVHLSSIGHPLIGDELYGGKPLGIHRQALHAAALYFVHPFGDEPITVDAPWPEDLIRLRQMVT